jgi:catechol 2,3-dioxygenase-like lactoylglutathione lyase family enzyme
MHITSLDHVSIPVTDLERSIAFYRDIMGLQRIPRPAFGSTGAWMAFGTIEVHLTVNPQVHFRPEPKVDTAEMHFAARVADFQATVRHLESKGYGSDRPDGDPRRMVLRLEGPAPYLQLYLLDPDNHVIEINDAAVKSP